ncbi:MAG: hypothetical protein HWQ41_05830 [Nostoc sp. NOS(2021)]|uniref:hypothetical protein n=1 Tax=Nostoc sp. NOS(2021) TaxID=2815407 RepID=UPI0025D55111|nr:hypothetical protein [Nostoc sp. NOS(2021)]MBN3894788.1 hypothetical protein [Nostoc sp. NOS(2021)]
MENKQQEMLDLLDEIYWNEGYSYGIEYFSQFLHKMEKYDFAKILASQAKFPVQYVLSFILSTPSLWINFLDTDWIRIMSVLNPRPKPFSIEIFDAGYVDIHFLCKYMRVNAIELFLQQEKFSNEDKKRILQYSSKVAIFLFMNELDLENLDGNYYLHQDELEKVRLTLISTGKIKPLNYTEDELSEYIEKELKVYE